MTMTVDPVTTVTQDGGTAQFEITPVPDLRATQTTATLLTERSRSTREQVRQLSRSVSTTDQDIHTTEMLVRSARLAKSAPLDLLRGLADQGFAWRDIARLVGVSVPAIQKWRKGEGISGESRKRLADLAAACELLVTHYYVEDAAGWFETPLIYGVPVTPMDLWSEGRWDLLFDAAGTNDPESVIATLDPEWRVNYSTPFTIVHTEDGQRSLQSRDD